MTVATQSNLIVYDGDGAAVTFNFPFPVYDASHLKVYSMDKTTGVQTPAVGFTPAGIGDAGGGSITFGVAPANTVKIILTRQLPIRQDLDVDNQGGFFPENFEVELDLMTMMIQQLQETVSRTIRLPLGETADAVGPPASRKGLLLGFSNDANGFPILTSADMQDAWLLEDGSGVGGGGGSGATVSDEAIRDAIGAALTQGALVIVTVDDVGNTINVAVDTATLDERIRDVIGATLINGVGTTFTVDDAGNTIAINAASNLMTTASAATVTPTFAFDQVDITAQAVNLTLANPTGTPIDGHGILIRIKDNGTSRTITYGSKYRAFNDGLPAATTLGKTLYLGIVYDAADDKWDVLGVRVEA